MPLVAQRSPNILYMGWNLYDMQERLSFEGFSYPVFRHEHLFDFVFQNHSHLRVYEYDETTAI
jgi:hypothetical protein